MKIHEQLEILASTRQQIRALCNRAKRLTFTLAQYLREREEILKTLPTYPRCIRQMAGEYAKGCYDTLNDHFIVHLYNVDGRLYRLTNEHRPELAHLAPWDELPRERHANLSGALYWINDGNPVIHFSITEA